MQYIHALITCYVVLRSAMKIIKTVAFLSLPCNKSNTLFLEDFSFLLTMHEVE